MESCPWHPRRYARQINAWLAAGNLKATIHCTLRLSQAAEAHRMQAHGGLLGKIVLIPDE
ncbi:MAG: zinc-binding dehydrogenase [Pirellulales bacterium]|jgi:NADPH:quinone reductase-like Zn-dependent oxidoreductase|nr:zinc-binding dehydrogenase [Thermoguttaceae bacterium]MDD4789660.1 zinc-binding dehydrogenase [Pirellulales bacterium]NLZ01207.1 zinc-binding dehydrogenase [Pirellulaceae bacterium]